MFPCLPPSRPFFCRKEGGWGWVETLLALFTAETLGYSCIFLEGLLTSRVLERGSGLRLVGHRYLKLYVCCKADSNM